MGIWQGTTRLFMVCMCIAATRHVCGNDTSAEWRPLLHSDDLNNWTPKIAGYEAGDNYADTFRVTDGVLRISYDNYEGAFNDRFGHLFYNEPYSNYVLRGEYRTVGERYEGAPDWAERNSGVMIHGESPQSMRRDQHFPVSLEVQLLSSKGDGPRTTGNLCTPGTNVVRDGKLFTPHCVNSTSKTYPHNEWVALEVEVHGGKLIRHKIEGETVIEYSEPQLDERDQDGKRLLDAGAEKMLTGGTISLQAEGHPVEFRKVELKMLTE